eukprot:5852602-Alexandrium_andersonii.AAC.1
MSASLVGSEMCIRDSARASRFAFARARAGAHARAHARTRARARSGQRERCLLYTSDAADDM